MVCEVDEMIKLLAIARGRYLEGPICMIGIWSEGDCQI